MHGQAEGAILEVQLSAAPRPREFRWDLWVLLALTVFSAEICFNRLWYPPLLIDECFTYWRTCGTMDQLLDTLRNDAFVPLHYELLNWIHQGFPLGFGFRIIPGGIFLTPTVMRFFPALCGTAMTPVMYFLGRQMFNRRTAIIAAIFIACSAYGLFFSRNAKMYAPAWMLETLTIACFLWWVRTWLRLAWLCWIAAGIAAGGFHAVTMLLVPLAPLYFISMGKFRGWRVPMLIGGLLLICAGPAIYYGCYNRWTRNSGGLVPGVVGEPAPDAQWGASGLDWLEHIDNSVQPSFGALNTYLTGIEWSTIDDLEHPSGFIEKFSTAMIALFMATYGLFFLGAMPWPYLKKSGRVDRPVQPWWRSLLWLLLWLVMPVYGFFYCRSVEDFSSPLVWLQSLVQILGAWWWGALGGMACIALALAWLPRAAKFVAIPLLLLAVAGIVEAARNNFDWWVAARPPAIAMAVAVVCGTIFHYSGATLRQRSIELLRLLAVVGVVLSLCGVMFFAWTWMHEVSMRKHPELPWQPVWNTRYVGIVWPAVWLAAAALVSRLPTPVLRIAAVLLICSYNLTDGLAREYASTEVPFDRLVGDIYKSQMHSDTRTYFEMHVLFDSTYYKPLALYNACVVARLEPSPAEFRIGRSWPFQYGAAADWFRSRCIYNSEISDDQIRDDLKNDSGISKVIVWEVSRLGFWSWQDDEAPKAGLTGAWKKTDDETITSHWYWDWHAEWTFRRREFDRMGGS
jgi:hypothetical protein